jgi:REP-associated tyrosine transposase
MPSYNSLLTPEHYFHVFNRAVGDEKIFRTEENYDFFLRKFHAHIPPVATLYCYNLLPNHFHLFLKINPLKEIESLFLTRKGKKMATYDNKVISEFIMEQFSNFFNSYTKSYNKVYNRKGKLFMDHLKRNEVCGDAYYSKIIHYIHANAVQHGYCRYIKDWPFSSYNQLIQVNPDSYPAEEIFNWFGGKTGFILFHQQPIKRRNKH